jgi:putative SOS response-associated peptidase YedK
MARRGLRYALTAPAPEVQALFGYRDEVDFPPRYDIGPTQPIAVVHRFAEERRFTLMRWGFVPAFVKDPREISLLATARAETVRERPAFRGAFRHCRCLMPATGFYAWQRGPRGEPRPFLVRPRSRGCIGLAGIWETWCGADGSEIDTACLLTIAANPIVAPLSARMPVIIAAGDFERWLGADDSAGGLLRQAPADLLLAEPVGARADPVKKGDRDPPAPGGA